MARVIQRLVNTTGSAKTKKAKELWLYWEISNEKASVTNCYAAYSDIPNRASLVQMPGLEVTKDQFFRYEQQI